MSVAPELDQPHLMNTYGRLPIGHGVRQGLPTVGCERQELPRRAGRHRRQHPGPRPPQAGAGAAGPDRQLIHSSNYYCRPTPRAGRQADRAVGREQRVLLLHRAGGQRGGAEAGAQVRPRQGHRAPEIVVYEKAFHGRSIATLSATGNPKVQAGFGPLVEGFIRVPLNDIEALKKPPPATPTWWRCSSRPSRAKAA